MDYTRLFIFTIGGITILSLLTTVGAIVSRKLQFRYAYLSVLHTILYVLLGYLVCKEYDLGKAVLVNALVGFYDGTVGDKLGELCKPYLSEEDLESDKEMKGLIPENMSLPLTVLFAMFLAFPGYWMT